MAAAMASGDVNIGLSQGVPSVVVADSAGQDLQVIDIAVSYSDNQNCVVQKSLGIDKSNTDKLVGTVGSNAYALRGMYILNQR